MLDNQTMIAHYNIRFLLYHSVLCLSFFGDLSIMSLLSFYHVQMG